LTAEQVMDSRAKRMEISLFAIVISFGAIMAFSAIAGYLTANSL
jgi:hypothetical protein